MSQGGGGKDARQEIDLKTLRKFNQHDLIIG